MATPTETPYASRIPWARLSGDGRAAVEACLEAGQGGPLFARWSEAAADDEAAVARKVAMVEDLACLHAGYPGGLQAYTASAVRLLADGKAGVNPLDGMVPAVPSGALLTDSKAPAYEAACCEGLRHVGDCCLVMVAGGLGERLGYPGIKVALPVETVTLTSMLQHYVSYVKEWERRGGDGCVVPFAIMTSDDTHRKTLALLEDNAYFGASPEQVTLVKQGKVPALASSAGDFCTACDDPYTVVTKPHGHGDVHQLLHRHGLAEEWAAAGKKWVVFIQDTHAQVVHKILATLGVSAKEGYAMNSITVPRRPGEASGSVCRLAKKDGSDGVTTNVEYNQLNPLLQAAFGRDDAAAEGCPDGFSAYPGNVNSFVVEMGAYVRALKVSGGLMPEFVNPKYTDAKRTAFKSPTRLECMMQDLPRHLGPAAHVGHTMFARDTYCPVKNSPADGAKNQAAGRKASCAVDGEAAYHSFVLGMLGAASGGLRIVPSAGAESETWLGVTVPRVPRVVLDAAFALTRSDVGAKVQNVTLSQRSVLVLRGRRIVVKNLTLDGTLVVEVPNDDTEVVIDGLRVANGGWPRVAFDGDTAAEPALAIRGYRTDTAPANALVLRYTEPGRFVVGPEAAAQL